MFRTGAHSHSIALGCLFSIRIITLVIIGRTAMAYIQDIVKTLLLGQSVINIMEDILQYEIELVVELSETFIIAI